ncbi:oligosaccharide flippase family protein [Sphingomonas sp. MMS24-J13]|uniref:oligosaccharide flippase family protein n=1 Tax=Sphingomonas sp. MMS24-J13 TaxID=3238686 RepID=UPI00384B20E7
MNLSIRRLKQAATGGAASVAASAIANNVLRIFSNITLTRLLDPEAFGIVSIIVSVSTMLVLISDVGLFDFIVQHKEGDEKRFQDQIWTIRLARGAMLAAAMALLSHPIALALGKPVLGPVIAVWSLSFVLDGLSSLSFAVAVRNQQFWRLSMMELAANVATLLMSVTAAFLTHSYWSMIAGMTTGALTKTILSYVMFPQSRRRWHFDFTRSRELWGFSRYIAMSSILTLIVMQSDKLVLARVMPLAAYGFYGIASQLAAAPAGLAGPYSSRVLLSAYAQAARAGREKLREIYYVRRRKVALLYMFSVGGMIGGAPLLVAILYQPRYNAVTPYLQLLLIATALRMPNFSAKWALIALGRTRATFFCNLCSGLWLLIGGGISLWLGNIMLLVAVVGTAEVPSLFCYWWNLQREGLLDFRSEAFELGSVGAGAGVGWAAATATLHLFPHI